MTPDEIVGRWSRDWSAALPPVDPARQTAMLSAVREAVGTLQRAATAGAAPGRALHRKAVLESDEASFEVLETVPAPLRVGPLVPGSVWPVSLRLSNAFPVAQPDSVPDQRGLAVRIARAGERLDLLATTGEAHHARDDRAMVASLRAAAAATRGGPRGRLAALTVLIRELGPRDGLRMARTVSRAAESGTSAAGLTFYSRAPFQLGDFAVRYRFGPVAGSTITLQEGGAEDLAADLRQRLERVPVVWLFELQGYLDPISTPMDDHRVAWRSPWVPVGRLTLSGERAPSGALSFNPVPSWSDPRGAVFEPLGSLNALRATAYEASRTSASADAGSLPAPV